MASRTDPISGGAIGSRSYGGREEEHSKPSLATCSYCALLTSFPDQEMVPEESTPNKIPSGSNVSWSSNQPSKA
jgi:hypothetical protein